MFVLVPMFGLQLFLIIYRPPGDWPELPLYDIVSTVVIDSQVGMPYIQQCIAIYCKDLTLLEWQC